jgi:1-acyl-sn-glycerol-3-phosphate acyltransferase
MRNLLVTPFKKAYFWIMRKVIGALCFAYKLWVGIVFVVTLLFFYPFIFITLLKLEWRKYSFPINVVWSFTVRILTWVHVWYIKRSPLPKGPYLIVANHTSYFDIFLMYSILPKHRFLFMGKSEILSYPLVKTFFKKLNIPVHRNDRVKAAKAFIQAKKAIEDGWSLVIFPEGGIPDNKRPQMIPFKEGAFKLAKSTGIPIVPITFLDNYHLFSDPDQLDYAHPGISRVCIHPHVPAEEVKALSEKELEARCFDAIAAPLRERGLMH